MIELTEPKGLHKVVFICVAFFSLSLSSITTGFCQTSFVFYFYVGTFWELRRICLDISESSAGSSTGSERYFWTVLSRSDPNLIL